MNQVDDKDGNPCGDRNGCEGDKGNEWSVEAVGIQHEVRRTGEYDDDIDDNGLHPFDLDAQG